MYFLEPVSQNSLFNEVSRLTGVTKDVYKYKDILARINDALDKYWALATQGAPKLGLDDTSQSSYPLETQNLTENLNYYQISDFTNTVLKILRLAVLNDDAIESELEHEQFDNIDRFLETYDTAVTGTPDHWTRMGDFIYVRPTPNYTEANGLRAYVNRELSKYTFTTCTISNATPAVVTATAHGLVDYDTVVLVSDGDDLPAGLSVNTIYYVTKVDADTFKLSTTRSGVSSSYVNTTDAGTGTHAFVKTNKEPGIPSIHHLYLARKAALANMDEKHPKFRALMKQIGSAQAGDPYYGGDELAIVKHWASQNDDVPAIINPARRAFK